MELPRLNQDVWLTERQFLPKFPSVKEIMKQKYKQQSFYNVVRTFVNIHKGNFV